jgi:hypothetical protein
VSLCPCLCRQPTSRSALATTGRAERAGTRGLRAGPSGTLGGTDGGCSVGDVAVDIRHMRRWRCPVCVDGAALSASMARPCLRRWRGPVCVDGAALSASMWRPCEERAPAPIFLSISTPSVAAPLVWRPCAEAPMIAPPAEGLQVTGIITVSSRYHHVRITGKCPTPCTDVRAGVMACAAEWGGA